MFKIIRKEIFSPTTFSWEVLAPDVAVAGQPGQFVMVRLREGGERIPLTIADFDRKKGTVTIVVKVAGRTTEEMSAYPEGGEFSDFIGPLGNPTRIEKRDHVVLVGGGLGVAPIFPVLRGFKEAGSRTTTIIGFRNTAEIFWSERFHQFSDRLILVTEDGSSGEKGTTIDALRKVVEGGALTSREAALRGRLHPALSHGDFLRSPVEGATQAPMINEVFAVGPVGMMQATAEVTRPFKIPTIVSINSIMVDGIGMCGSCRVTLDGKVVFACVDGPDMDAHKVDFEEMKIRLGRFRGEEQESLRRYHEECALKKKGIG